MPERVLFLIIGLIGIGLVIFLHELGHFAAARIFSVDVEVLSYGFGPKLISFYGRNTEYRISAIPFGGYCRMKGSMDLSKALRDNSGFEKAESGSYFAVHPGIRFLIYLAGPLANFLLAVLILAISATIPVNRLSDPAIVVSVAEYPELFPDAEVQPGIERGDKLLSADGIAFLDWQDASDYLSQEVKETPVLIQRDSIIESVLVPVTVGGMPSYGITNLQRPVIGRSISDDFRQGDIIIEADGRKIESTLDLYAIGKDSFTMLIDRDGEILERKIENGELPFAWESDIRVTRDSKDPLLYGLRRASSMFVSALQALGAFITFHLEDALSVITGPVKAAESLGSISVLAFQDSASSGIRSVLLLLAIVSVSISVGNTLPIPTFDGGQMLIALYELIRRRSLSPRAYVILQIIGMAAALMIMVMMYSLDIKAYLL